MLRSAYSPVKLCTAGAIPPRQGMAMPWRSPFWYKSCAKNLDVAVPRGENRFPCGRLLADGGDTKSARSTGACPAERRVAFRCW